MDRIDFVILLLLYKNTKNEIQSLTICELMEKEEMKGNEDTKKYKVNSLYKRIKRLEQMGYIERGVKCSKKHTFYITEEGKEYLENKRNI